MIMWRICKGPVATRLRIKSSQTQPARTRLLTSSYRPHVATHPKDISGNIIDNIPSARSSLSASPPRGTTSACITYTSLYTMIKLVLI